ncbi:MAG: 5'-nucleotidase C-terminal domain-containing protein [Candidatus Gastranaerophilales bacterium]|nr:5'-nucleotidase C-terminal domain-containing protein [Candidatus Gastranaerophilales bacterium]
MINFSSSNIFSGMRSASRPVTSNKQYSTVNTNPNNTVSSDSPQQSLWTEKTASIYNPQQSNNEATKIKIGYINDFHGQLTKMERTIIPLQDCDLRLSGGDNFLGDERNEGLNKGVAKYMNLANIEASPVGNHELDMSQKKFMEITKDLNTTLVDCNYRQVIDDPKEAERLYKETNKAPINDRFINSFVKEVNGQKYGIIGVSPVDMDERYTHADYYDDCKVDSLEDSIQDVQKEVQQLQNQGINKVILLSHMGYKLDKEMATKTSGVDVIIGGHSHNLVEGLTEGENLLKSKTGEPVVITNGGKDGEYFGNLEVEFDKNGVITNADNKVIPTTNYGRNLIYSKILESDIEENEKVGYIRSVLPQPKNRLMEENPQANFVADAIRSELGVEIAFLNSANLRSSFEKGAFTRLDAKMISPFHNQMVIANVTEKDLVDAFKFTCKTMVNTRPGLFAVSGLKYTVRKSDGELLSLTKVDDNGKETPINIENPSDTKTYRISADSFVMRGGDKVSSLNYVGREEKVFEFDKDTLVCDYIKHHNGPVDINQAGRVNIV